MLLGFLGWTEIAIVVVIVLLIFGPKNLPLLGSSFGKMLRGFKDELKEIDQDRSESVDSVAAKTQADRAEIDVTPVDPAEGSKSKPA